MTSCAESYKIIWIVSLVLILEMATSFNMMDIKTAASRATLCTAILTYFITAAYVSANCLPISTVRQFFSTSIVRTVFANHKLDSTLTRTKTTSIFCRALKCAEGFTAILAIQINSRYKALIGAFRRAMFNLRTLLMKLPATNSTIGIGYSRPFPGNVTVAGTKYVFSILACSARLPFKLLTAMGTSQSFGFAERIYSAFTRTMIHVPLIGFECLATLEAGFDH
jgi:hypothetical protein